MSRRAIVLALLLPGCATVGTTRLDLGQRPPLDRAGIAAEIDPGAPAPLCASLPAVLGPAIAERISSLSTPAERLARARRIHEASRLAEIDAVDTPLGRLTALTEGYCALEALALGPLAEETGPALDMLGLYGGSGRLMRDVAGLRGQATGEIVEHLDRLASAAEKLQHRLAARLLREGSGEPLGRALRWAAEHDREAYRFARALSLVEELLRLAGRDASAADLLLLAQSYFLVDDLGRGQAATMAARRIGGPRAEVRGAKALGTAAALSRLPADPPTIEAAMERARLLLEQGRIPAARDLGDRWRQRRPRDARPVVVLARCRLQEGSDILGRFVAARELLDGAAGLDEKDGGYYGLLIGLRGFTLLREVAREAGGDQDAFYRLMARRVDEFRALGREHARFAPRRAAVLGFLLDGLAQALALRGGSGDPFAATKALVPKAIAVARASAGESDGYQLSLAAAAIDPDRARAFAALAAPPPVPVDEDPAPHLRRLQVLAGLAAYWRDPAQARAALAALAELPSLSGPQLALANTARADARAVIARSGEAAAWPAAEADYRAALADADDEQRGRLLNNLAVAVAQQGREREAIDLWTRVAAQPGKRKWAARVNIAAATERLGDAATARELVDALAGEQAGEPDGEVAVQVLLWQAARARQAGAALPEGLVGRLRAALADPARSGLLPEERFGEDGWVHSGSFGLRLGASALREDYVLDLQLATEPWLVAPAPLRPADLLGGR